MSKYEMDPTSILEDTERTLFCPQTDRRANGRRTDGQTDTWNPVEGGGGGGGGGLGGLGWGGWVVIIKYSGPLGEKFSFKNHREAKDTRSSHTSDSIN